MNKTNVQNETQHDPPPRHAEQQNAHHQVPCDSETEKMRHWNCTCKTPASLPVHSHPPCACTMSKIERTVVVAGGGEETLTAVSTLLAQCSKVGGNLNQLARHFNSGGADTEQLRAKLLDELADLTAFRLNAEKVLGELYGNAQAYRL